MPPKKKILSHPMKEEIDGWLKDSVPVIEIVSRVKERYPGDRELHLSEFTLHKYRDSLGLEPKTQTRKKRSQIEKMAEDNDLSKRFMVLTGRSPPPPEPRRFISDEKIMSWADGVDGFAAFVEDMIIERGIHIELQDYQREMADAFLKYTRVVVCAGGQVGKDMMIMAYSIWLAITNPGSSQLIVCSTQTQSTGLMDRTIETINSDSELAATLSATQRKPEYALFFKNSARIYYLTAKSRIAGKTNILCAWFNEARDIDEDEVTRVWWCVPGGRWGRT